MFELDVSSCHDWIKGEKGGIGGYDRGRDVRHNCICVLMKLELCPCCHGCVPEPAYATIFEAIVRVGHKLKRMRAVRSHGEGKGQAPRWDDLFARVVFHGDDGGLSGRGYLDRFPPVSRRVLARRIPCVF